MRKIRSAQRIFFLFLSIIIVTAKIFAQESSKDFKRMNILHQVFEQNKEFRQYDVKKHPIVKHACIDTLMQLPLFLNEQSQTKMLKKIFSPQSDMFVVDTAIVRTTSDTSRIIYTYDANGNRLSELAEKWTNDQWVNDYRYTYTYDANGNWLSRLYELGTNDQWVNSSRLTYTYDANGSRLSYLYEQWTNDQWVNSSRSTFINDANGNQLSYLSERWTNDQWVNGSRVTTTYDANGNQLSSLNEGWTNDQWVNYYRYTNTYDANGNQLSYLYENWTNDQWVISFRWTYTYDANGNQLSYLNEQWTNGQWVNYFRLTNTYDANGNCLLVLYELWRNDQWVTFGRWTNTYDANGNCLSELYELWTNDQWVNSYRYTYTYFQNELLSEGTYEEWENSSWIPSNDDISTSSDSYYGYKISLTYKLVTSSVSKDDEIIPQGYSLSQNYPNPFNPTTTIEYRLAKESHVKIIVSDVLGREMKTLVNERKSAGRYTVQFNANDLSSGIYFYQLKTKEFSQTNKFILMK